MTGAFASKPQDLCWFVKNIGHKPCDEKTEVTLFIECLYV